MVGAADEASTDRGAVEQVREVAMSPTATRKHIAEIAKEMEQTT